MLEPIAATLSLDAAVGRSWDIVVIGAGPAGAVAARELAGQARVLLIDRARFPRAKVCGCCLNGAALQTLQRMGLGNLTAQAGAVPLRELQLAYHTRVARVDLQDGVVLSRTRLDLELIKAAIAAGAEFLDETQASIGNEQPDGRRLELKSEDGAGCLQARQVVVAGGLGCRAFAESADDARQTQPDSRIGTGTVVEDDSAEFAAGSIYMACHRNGYVGLTRLEDGQLDIAAALDGDAVKQAGGVAELTPRILAEAGFAVPSRMPDAVWHGTAKLTQQRSSVAGNGYFVIGDAAGYVEPFTGEGIAWALATGRAVAPIVAAGLRGEVDAADSWTRRHRQLLGKRMRLCRSVSGLLRSRLLVRAAVGLLSLAPGLARPIVRSLNAPYDTD